MGSVEVYDFNKMQWVPYVPDFNKWIRHFEDISAGRVRPDFKGRYIVGSGSRHGPDSSTRQQEPNVKLVTPVAQAIEMAKSELNREKEDAAHIFPKSIRKPQSRPPGKVYYKPRAKKPKFDTQFDN